MFNDCRTNNTTCDAPPLQTIFNISGWQLSSSPQQLGLSEVVKTIVQQRLEECSVEGEVQGKAKLNLDVKGDVTAKIVCEKNTDTEAE